MGKEEGRVGGRVGEKRMVNAKVLFFALFSDFPENLF